MSTFRRNFLRRCVDILFRAVSFGPVIFQAIIATTLLLPAPKGTTLVLGGDIMLNQLPLKSKPLESLKPLFESGTVTLANLEIPLTDTKAGTPYKSAAEIKARTQYILKADPKFAPQIKAVGIDLVSLGNNHAMDYRADGLNQMIQALTQQGILYTGAGPTLSEAKEIVSKANVGLVSALAFMNTSAINKLTPARDDRPGIHALFFNGTVTDKAKAYLKDWISGQRGKNEIVVVALHWGIERMTTPTPYQVALARACIDAGADVVWGHHPHVLQGAEVYKGKPILYSMGNLISKKEGPTGLARIYFEDGQFKKFRFLPCQISGGRAKPTPEKQSKPRLEAFKRLSQAISRKYKSKFAQPLY